MEGLELIKSTTKGLTWKEVKELLNSYPDTQLETLAIVHKIDNEECEINGFVMTEFYETSEDHINPSGEGLAPISLCEPDEIENEEIILKKGTPIIYIE